MNNNKIPKNLKTKSAAEYLHQLGIDISPNTLVMWRSQGKGPQYKKIMRKVFYEKEQLDKFAEGKKIPQN